MKSSAERLKYTIEIYGYNRRHNRLAKSTHISPSRFSRILKGAPMYDFEVVALVTYFPGLSYRWLLEGAIHTTVIEQALDTLAGHMLELSVIERRQITDLLRDQSAD